MQASCPHVSEHALGARFDAWPGGAKYLMSTALMNLSCREEHRRKMSSAASQMHFSSSVYPSLLNEEYSSLLNTKAGKTRK